MWSQKATADNLSSIDDSINEEAERVRNIDEEFEREYIFELDYIFNLTPPIREGPHRSGDTLATLATNASQATRLLQAMTERKTGLDENG